MIKMFIGTQANTHGDTALHIAAREDHYSCVTALLAAGADPNIVNKEEQTAVEVSTRDLKCLC